MSTKGGTSSEGGGKAAALNESDLPIVKKLESHKASTMPAWFSTKAEGNEELIAIQKRAHQDLSVDLLGNSSWSSGSNTVILPGDLEDSLPVVFTYVVAAAKLHEIKYRSDGPVMGVIKDSLGFWTKQRINGTEELPQVLAEARADPKKAPLADSSEFFEGLCRAAVEITIPSKQNTGAQLALEGCVLSGLLRAYYKFAKVPVPPNSEWRIAQSTEVEVLQNYANGFLGNEAAEKILVKVFHAIITIATHKVLMAGVNGPLGKITPTVLADLTWCCIRVSSERDLHVETRTFKRMVKVPSEKKGREPVEQMQEYTKTVSVTPSLNDYDELTTEAEREALGKLAGKLSQSGEHFARWRLNVTNRSVSVQQKRREPRVECAAPLTIEELGAYHDAVDHVYRVAGQVNAFLNLRKKEQRAIALNLQAEAKADKLVSLHFTNASKVLKAGLAKAGPMTDTAVAKHTAMLDDFWVNIEGTLEAQRTVAVKMAAAVTLTS